MKNVLVEQNLHWQNKIQAGIIREKLKDLIAFLEPKQIITISGIRRCGKSTLLKQAINHLIEAGVNSKNILFLNLEHPFFIQHKQNINYLNHIFDEYIKIANPQGKIYFFIDEVQFFENWQVFVKNKYETQNVKFVVTGSNSSLLSSDLHTLLTGRCLNISLSSFNFREFLNYKGIEHKDEIQRIKNKIDIRRAFDEYLKWGGFFEVFYENNESIKKEILISYAKSIIFHDIIPRYQIRHHYDIEKVFYYIMSNACGLINYKLLSNALNINDKTIKEYLRYFEDAFIVKTIDKFHFKIKEQLKSAKKLYVTDNGFLQLGTFPIDSISKEFEQIILNYLINKNDNVFYLREKYEVDFFDNKNLYQASYSMENEKTKKREINSLMHFMNEMKKQNGYIITYNENDTIELENKTIKILSADEFILENS